jgi:hypothetical protein
MNISLEFLQLTNCSFHGVVPESPNAPLGGIELAIGNRHNFRREKLEFEVNLLDDPHFSRFMAIPHYTYLVLKILGPNGIITVKGNFKLSNTCDKEFNKIAQTFGMIDVGRSLPD